MSTALAAASADYSSRFLLFAPFCPVPLPCGGSLLGFASGTILTYPKVSSVISELGFIQFPAWTVNETLLLKQRRGHLVVLVMVILSKLSAKD